MPQQFASVRGGVRQRPVGNAQHIEPRKHHAISMSLLLGRLCSNLGMLGRKEVVEPMKSEWW